MRMLSVLGVLVTIFASSIGCGGESESAPPTSTAPVTPPAPTPTATPIEPAPATVVPAPTSEPVAAVEAPTTGLGSTDGDPSRLACTTDDDCMIAPASRCCAPCCDCPTVMRRDAWEQMQRVCSIGECLGHDCRGVRCEPCGILTAVHCVAGVCTGS